MFLLCEQLRFSADSAQNKRAFGNSSKGSVFSNGGVERIRTSAPVTQPNDLANRPLKPLEYHSIYMAGAVRIELTTYGFGDRCSTN